MATALAPRFFPAAALLLLAGAAEASTPPVVVAAVDGAGDAHNLDWAVVTHIFVSGGLTPWLLATAKAHDVRVLGTFGCTWLESCPDFTNSTNRSAWVRSQLHYEFLKLELWWRNRRL